MSDSKAFPHMQVGTPTAFWGVGVELGGLSRHAQNTVATSEVSSGTRRGGEWGGGDWEGAETRANFLPEHSIALDGIKFKIRANGYSEGT